MEPPLTAPTDPVVSLRDLRFGWRRGVPVLAIERLEVASGERVFLRGPSGSGKSTLLSLIAGVARPPRDAVTVFGTDMGRACPATRDRLRGDRMGVVFQMFNLIPYLDARENIALACRLSPRRRARVAATGGETAEVRRLCARLGLGPGVMNREVATLSVGQQQRVALARALIGGPELIIADEPTSALDTDARDAFIGLLREMAAETGAALLFVSHDPGLAQHFDRVEDLTRLNGAWTPPALV